MGLWSKKSFQTLRLLQSLPKKPPAHFTKLKIVTIQNNHIIQKVNGQTEQCHEPDNTDKPMSSHFTYLLYSTMEATQESIEGSWKDRGRKVNG